MNQNIIAYYNDRAAEYDKVYLNPAEQDDLHSATTFFQTLFAGKTVLELACGTGYWTERIAKTASSILATDINEAVIQIARARHYTSEVSFAIADMYQFCPETKYDAVFCGFIWSHILLQDLDVFLQRIKSFLHPGGAIAFIDNHPLTGTRHDLKRITKTDEAGNTWQTRQLENNTTHLVLKNFPTKDFLVQKLSDIATDFNFISLTHYWIASCQLK